MSRLDDVIKQVKSSRHGAWIYDSNGNIKDDVLVGDALPLLEALKDVEMDVTDEWIDEFLEDPNTEGDNTYNWGANISNDLNFNSGKDENGDDVMVIMVHLHGDIRGGYSDYFVVKCSFEDMYYQFDDAIYQSKSINDRYSADINLFSEGYNVYDYETGEDLGEFYELEAEDALKEIEEQVNSKGE